MRKYSVEIVPKAEKEFLKLPSAVRDRIRDKILGFEVNPKPFGSKKLRETNFYRIRIGDYRVVYSVQENSRLVKVLSIAHRKEVYRGL
jgi:mRNA interferase RelE/StbE